MLQFKHKQELRSSRSSSKCTANKQHNLLVLSFDEIHSVRHENLIILPYIFVVFYSRVFNNYRVVNKFGSQQTVFFNFILFHSAMRWQIISYS